MNFIQTRQNLLLIDEQVSQTWSQLHIKPIQTPVFALFGSGRRKLMADLPSRSQEIAAASALTSTNFASDKEALKEQYLDLEAFAHWLEAIIYDLERWRDEFRFPLLLVPIVGYNLYTSTGAQEEIFIKILLVAGMARLWQRVTYELRDVLSLYKLACTLRFQVEIYILALVSALEAIEKDLASKWIEDNGWTKLHYASDRKLMAFPPNATMPLLPPDEALATLLVRRVDPTLHRYYYLKHFQEQWVFGSFNLLVSVAATYGLVTAPLSWHPLSLSIALCLLWSDAISRLYRYWLAYRRYRSLRFDLQNLTSCRGRFR